MTSVGARTTMGIPPGESPRAQLRLLNLFLFLPLQVASGVVTVWLHGRSWVDVLVLAAGAAAAVVTFIRWSAGEARQVALPCIAVGAGVWLYGVLELGASATFASLLVCGALSVPYLARPMAAGTGLLLLTAGIGALRFLVTDAEVSDTVMTFLIIPIFVTATVTGLMFPNKGFYDVVNELEESRDREAELAVARERIRFAGDLHDIQGHTLHVVKLKIALARKLLHSDPDRAEQELAEVYTLVGDTISQTKELAYAQRRLNLSVELENAKNLFEAAGIEVRVDRGGAQIDDTAGELLGQVLRETTTNILRHAQAEQVTITLGPRSIDVVNDGAAGDTLPPLRGLATLHDRLADLGGTLTVQQDGDIFRTRAVLAPEPV